VAVSVYHHVFVTAAIDGFILLKLSLLHDLVFLALSQELNLSHDHGESENQHGWK